MTTRARPRPTAPTVNWGHISVRLIFDDTNWTAGEHWVSFRKRKYFRSRCTMIPDSCRLIILKKMFFTQKYVRYASSTRISRVSCQKGLTRHAYAWQIGPFWQDTLDMWFKMVYINGREKITIIAPIKCSYYLTSNQTIMQLTIYHEGLSVCYLV